MGEKRQKNQLVLAFSSESRGEAPTAKEQGTEAPRAKRATESPAHFECDMEGVVERENLRRALKRVQQNGGSPGVDGMTVKELPDYLRAHWPEIRERLLNGTYKPQPVKRVEIPKPGGGVRKLGIPTVLDRFIQQAILQVMQGDWDRTFSEHSFGFRPGRSAQQAVAKAQEYVGQGYTVVVDLDLEKFFDRVNHDMLMGRVAKRGTDKRMLKLLRAFLNAGVMENGLVEPTDEGTPQGGPLSPLLSNIVLDDLDKELERRGLRFVRYADDCNIYIRTPRAGERVMESLTRFIERKLKLKVNREKSAVGRPRERKFLGFRLLGGKEVKRGIAPSALSRVKARVRELTRRTTGRSIQQITEGLTRYLRGWKAYFGYCQTPSVLRSLDSWIRRRLRAIVWKQWRRGRTRFRELRKRGVGKDLAAQTAGSAHGTWRISRSPALSFALPGAYFDSLGLPTLAPKVNA
jgi:RNA-directed DNA polymerase